MLCQGNYNPYASDFRCNIKLTKDLIPVTPKTSKKTHENLSTTVVLHEHCSLRVFHFLPLHIGRVLF
jgi:hypothetical protein